MPDNVATPGVQLTTSDDIYFELNGKKIAGVESYDTKYSNDVKLIDAFGQSTPIGFAVGSKKHTIDISRAYLEDTAIADGIDLYALAMGVNLVIIKKGKRVVYKDCIVSDISESGSLKDKVAEKFTMMALSRVTE